LPKKLISITLNEELCKGCGYCVEFCPREVFGGSDELSRKAVVPPEVKDEARCTDCGLCAMLCPELAISVETREGKADD